MRRGALQPGDALVLTKPLGTGTLLVARAALQLDDGEPCLLLHRRTFSGGAPASVAELWHAGSRYRLTGHF